MNAPYSRGVEDITAFDQTHGTFLAKLRRSPEVLSLFDASAVANQTDGTTLFVPHNKDVKVQNLDKLAMRQHFSLHGLSTLDALAGAEPPRRPRQPCGFLSQHYAHACTPCGQNHAGEPMLHELTLSSSGHRITLQTTDGKNVASGSFKPQHVVELTQNTPQTARGARSIVFMEPSGLLDAH